ncbi:MAG: class I SAM-dependent methyltransferase [Anaerolineae bacterium]|nr:class I SAM-dependent methyltransferase [Anaerolineae bacterium]
MSRFGGYEEQSFLAELYDHIPGYAGRPDLDFYLTLARQAEGSILELGCGTGRVLIPTAQAGCRVVGLDHSRYMLAKCEEKLAAQPQETRERVRLVQETMVNFELEERFALVTTPFRPFQHLISVEEQLSCLRCANRHLHMGGKLVLDLFQVNLRYLVDPVVGEEREDFKGVPLSEGRTMRRANRVVACHRTEQYNDVEIIFYVTYPDGHTERLVQAFPFRYFFRYEIEHLLARCGFGVRDLYGSFDGSPLADDSPEMIFVAEKCQDIS